VLQFKQGQIVLRIWPENQQHAEVDKREPDDSCPPCTRVRDPDREEESEPEDAQEQEPEGLHEDREDRDENGKGAAQHAEDDEERFHGSGVPRHPQ